MDTGVIDADDRRTEIRSHAEALKVLGALDWEDTVGAGEKARDILTALAGDKPAMLAALAQVKERPVLFARCERGDSFRRIVLCEDPDTGVSLRLQFLTGCKTELPHNHRATFASLLLSGGYRHYLYQIAGELVSWPDDERGRMALSEADMQRIRPAQTRFESTGSFYALHHSAVHTTLPTEGHVSLVVRGPSARRRLLIIYKEEREAAYMYGGAEETAEQLLRKKLPEPEYERLAALVASAL